jgi:hypothetical protein
MYRDDLYTRSEGDVKKQKQYGLKARLQHRAPESRVLATAFWGVYVYRICHISYHS